MQNENTFAPGTLCLGVVTAAAGECVLRTEMPYAVHTVLIWGFWQALALVVVCALAAVSLPASGPAANLVRGALWLWLGFELVQTVWQAHSLCWQQFGSAAVLGSAPFLVWLGVKRSGAELDHTACVLWWFVLCGVLVCLAGLGGQMRWQRLVLLEEQSGQQIPKVPVYAEYFAIAMLCPRQARALRRAAWLPMAGFLVEAAFCMGFALLFADKSNYAGAELLRALSVGAFSRLDAFLLLIWLVLALFRVCFLCVAMRALRYKSTAPHCAQTRLC